MKHILLMRHCKNKILYTVFCCIIMRGDFVYDHSNWDPGIWQSGTGCGMCSGEGAGYGTGSGVHPPGSCPGENRHGQCAGGQCKGYGRLEEQHRCADPLRRQRYGSAGADSGNGRNVQRDRQLRHPCPDPGTFCSSGQGGQGFRPFGNHFRRLGSRPVFPGPAVQQRHPA
ncbi:unknown [Acidaminococcus sp. CAG:542]|nr:unknown [Acidaminococcus sp. CAG:542]